MLVFAVLPVAAQVPEGSPNALAFPAATTGGAILEVCGLVAVGVQFVLRRRYQLSRTHFIADGVRQLLTFGAFFLAEFLRYSLLPNEARAEGIEVLGWMGRYSTISLLQMALLVAVTGITAWLMLPPPRTVGKPDVTGKR